MGYGLLLVPFGNCRVCEEVLMLFTRAILHMLLGAFLCQQYDVY